MLSCIAVSSVSAQNIPSHDAYVKLYDDNVSQNFYDYFRTWEPGQALSEDENFFISRVPLKKRFENANTQVDPTLTTDRKFCMWTPMGVADTYWQSFPVMFLMAIISVCGLMSIRKEDGLCRGFVYRELIRM